MDKDTLEEFENVYRQASEGIETIGLALLRMQKLLEKGQEYQRLLGPARQAEEFMNPK